MVCLLWDVSMVWFFFGVFQFFLDFFSGSFRKGRELVALLVFCRVFFFVLGFSELFTSCFSSYVCCSKHGGFVPKLILPCVFYMMLLLFS